VTYPVLKLLSGRGREIGSMSYVIGALLVVYFVLVRSRLG
jgi:xanthine/uracil/vitamin C permease (AzgA family)